MPLHCYAPCLCLDCADVWTYHVQSRPHDQGLWLTLRSDLTSDEAQDFATKLRSVGYRARIVGVAIT